MKRAFLTLIFLSLTQLIFQAEAQNFSNVSRISDSISLTGDGNWDYLSVDTINNRLFVTHSTTIHIVDLNTRKQIGTFENLKGAHAIAFAYGLNKGFFTTGKDSSLVIFDLLTLKPTATLKIPGKDPNAIVFEQHSGRVFIFNSGSNTATVLDAASEKIIGSIYLDGKPKSAVSDGKGNVYVTIENIFLVDMINTETLKIDARWSVTPGDNPGGIAIDTANRRLFIGCGNSKMVIMDADLGNIIQTMNTDYGTDAVVWDPEFKRVYSSNGDGTLTIIQEISRDRYIVLDNIKTRKGARTTALDPKTHSLYIPMAEMGPAPKPSIDNSRQRPGLKAGTFKVLVISNAGKTTNAQEKK